MVLASLHVGPQQCHHCHRKHKIIQGFTRKLTGKESLIQGPRNRCGLFRDAGLFRPSSLAKSCLAEILLLRAQASGWPACNYSSGHSHVSQRSQFPYIHRVFSTNLRCLMSLRPTPTAARRKVLSLVSVLAESHGELRPATCTQGTLRKVLELTD